MPGGGGAGHAALVPGAVHSALLVPSAVPSAAPVPRARVRAARPSDQSPGRRATRASWPQAPHQAGSQPVTAKHLAFWAIMSEVDETAVVRARTVRLVLRIVIDLPKGSY